MLTPLMETNSMLMRLASVKLHVNKGHIPSIRLCRYKNGDSTNNVASLCTTIKTELGHSIGNESRAS